MDAVLLANAAATLLMTGLALFVQLVHYPLFALVGPDGWGDYHREHSDRTTWLVLPLMATELLTSWALALAPPPGAAPGLLAAGAALATATWCSTAVLQVPRHRELGGGFDAAVVRRLVRWSWVRTGAWVGHSGVVLAVLAA